MYQDRLIRSYTQNPPKESKNIKYKRRRNEREREKRKIYACVDDLPQCVEGGVGFDTFSNLAYIGDLIVAKTVLIQSYTKQNPPKESKNIKYKKQKK